MKFILLGAGSIGQRHLRNLLGLGHSPAAIFDPDPRTLETIRDIALGSALTTDESTIFNYPADAALICSPTTNHIRQALIAVERGLHVFIEKPLSHTLEGIDNLIEQASQRKRSVLVACNLRFLPSLKRVERLLNEGRIGAPLAVRAHCGYYLPYWRPATNYRLGYGAKEEGGGIILDCIHEFDYLRWLIGDVTEVFCYADKLSNLEIASEDTASIVFRFSTGAIGNLHLDYLQRTYRRSCEFIGEDGVIVWDYISQTVTLYGQKDRHSEVFQESINVEINRCSLKRCSTL